jgi:hypothetical protein
MKLTSDVSVVNSEQLSVKYAYVDISIITTDENPTHPINNR